MAKNFVQDGDTIEVTNDGPDISSGEIFTNANGTGFLTGIALSDAQASKRFQLRVTGVFDITKSNPVSIFFQGQKVYNDSGKATLTNTFPFVGICIETSFVQNPNVRVRLMPGGS